jgi:hypothetical protein
MAEKCHYQTFVRLQPKTITPRYWQVVAHCPDGEIHYITGFKSDSEALDWITNKSSAWLTQQGYGDA